MAAQQIHFAETIRAMKLAVRRQASGDTDDSDVDDYLHSHTNRGNKLKSGARFVKDGCLDSTPGVSYRKRVRHAGYERTIIAKKPRLYDDDGDIVDPLDFPSDADDDWEHGGEPLREDAYGQIQLERLLRPLTSASELTTHPSLSLAYTSNAITEMVEDAAEMIRRERVILWKAKRLLERFRGDGAWMSCDAFADAHDGMLLIEDPPDLDSIAPSFNMEDVPPSAIDGDTTSKFDRAREALSMPHTNGLDAINGNDGVERQDHIRESGVSVNDSNMNMSELPTNQANGVLTPGPEGNRAEQSNEDRASEQDSGERSVTNTLSHAMTTRARARSPNRPSGSLSPSPSDLASVPMIHPWFIPPHTAISDRNLGLPASEAENTRSTLLLYVQKQENVVRQLDTLYMGLRRTDRLRKAVWHACRAEGHMVLDGRGGLQTEMSDGEDWYDPDDWNLLPLELTEDGTLEKGKDEIEDPAEEEGRRVGGRRRRVVGR